MEAKPTDRSERDKRYSEREEKLSDGRIEKEMMKNSNEKVTCSRIWKI